MIELPLIAERLQRNVEVEVQAIRVISCSSVDDRLVDPLDAWRIERGQRLVKQKKARQGQKRAAAPA